MSGLNRRRLAVIGAGYLQLPLILKAKEMGLETHVFAWECGDVGEKAADVFYPISIVEKEAIRDKCREIGIDGICTIATDLGVVTANFVADALGLVSNSPAATLVSSNKHEMRKRFEAMGDPSPRSVRVTSAEDPRLKELTYPVIVKPVDRSGSRGITKLETPEGLAEAIGRAMDQGFEKCALAEEFAEGREFSVETLSRKGKHRFLSLTKKYTTGAPGFVETGHLEPGFGADTEAVKAVVFHALDSLGIEYGAAHSELKVDQNGKIRLIEIGGRMGGDLIGSDLVPLTTGVDFVGNVIRIALGEEPDLTPGNGMIAPAAVRFVFTREDLAVLERLKKEHPEYLVSEDIHGEPEGEVSDSSGRFGCFVMQAGTVEELLPYMPAEAEEL